MAAASLRVLSVTLLLASLIQGFHVAPSVLAAEFRTGASQLSSGRRPVSSPSPLKALSSGLTDGLGKLAEMFAPPEHVTPPADPTSLASRGTPSPQLYAAVGRLAEQSGKLDEAEQRYQQALKLDPRDLEALRGYARIKDKQGRLEEAIGAYQLAAQAHPDEANVFNELGLCYARQRSFPESIAAFRRATQLKPNEPLYRNNIATVLAEMGEVDAAFMELSAVHRPAVAYYNVAYLLQKQGQSRAAAALFAHSLKIDPSLQESRAWLEKLSHSAPLTPNPQRQPAVASNTPYEDPSVEAPDLRAPGWRQAAVPNRRPAEGLMPRQIDLPHPKPTEPRQLPSTTNRPTLRDRPMVGAHALSTPESGPPAPPRLNVREDSAGREVATPPPDDQPLIQVAPLPGDSIGKPSRLSAQSHVRQRGQPSVSAASALPVVQPLPPIADDSEPR